MEENSQKIPGSPATDNRDRPIVDEDAGIMVYGNLRIIDLDTGEILVNKRA